MSKNKANLDNAKHAKNDEFYTQFRDIETELMKYVDYNPDVFRGKTILLPCDDPEWSNFTKFLALKFDDFGIKKIISTSYNPGGRGKMFTLTGDTSGDGRVDLNDLTWEYLEGDGDFRSPEVTALRDEADMVVTNPPFSCYSDDTEVLTNRGWRLFQDVLDDDLICSLDLRTNGVEYVPFVERFVSRVDGELLHFGSRRFDLMVTDNHRMIARDSSSNPVRRDADGDEALIRADEVKAHHTVPTMGFSWNGEHAPTFVLPSTTQREQHTRREIDVPARDIPMGDWLEFFGMWLADGCTRQGINTQGNPRYTVSIKQSEENGAYVEDLFNRIGFPCKVERGKTGNHNYTAYSKQLWEYLAQFGDSRKKFIPREILALDADLLARLWTGYTNGDGHGNDKQYRVSSVSKPLMDGIQEVALKVLGQIIQVRQVNATYRDEPYVYYMASFSRQGVTKNFKYGKPERVEYHGNVHCLRLARNGTMLVRRAGKISWSGNCFREFLAWIVEADKRFLIIGSMNAITYKEVYPLISGNRMWLGTRSGSMEFLNPEGELVKFGNIRWYTNLDHGRRHESLQLMTMADNLRYSRVLEGLDGYERYANCDAIEVPQVRAIPSDHGGTMGVPISFLEKYCPEQFEIVGFRYGDDGKDLVVVRDGVRVTPYFRVLIRHTPASLAGTLAA